MDEDLKPPVVGTNSKPDRLRILSLTGGGYRGFFTATVLALLEKHIYPRKLLDCFNGGSARLSRALSFLASCTNRAFRVY